jgi:hypothetical protein
MDEVGNLCNLNYTMDIPYDKEPLYIQWKPLIMITLGLALFDNNNRLVTLSGGYKHLHYLTQIIVTVHFTCIKNNKIYLENSCSVACCLFAISSS